MANQLEGYESVSERIEKFWMKYLEIGRIETDPIFMDGTRYVVKAYGYREITDSVPFATGLAEEIRTAQNRFPLENAETSAIGRMLHNAGLSKFSEGIPRPSFDEMRRVNLQVVPTAEVGLTVTTEHDPWSSFGQAVDTVANNLLTGTAILDVPDCQHGPMAFKEGIGKTGAPYKGFVCTHKNREFQCPPRWQK